MDNTKLSRGVAGIQDPWVLFLALPVTYPFDLGQITYGKFFKSMSPILKNDLDIDIAIKHLGLA